MDKKVQPKKPQSNGLLEPYTVMLDSGSVVVEARSLDEAIAKAMKANDAPTGNEKEEEGDVS